MATQLITPNLDPIIRQPDGKGGQYIVTNWVGWCLAYVQTAFNTGWAGATAQSAWDSRLSKRHTDRNIPSGVYVPIWFSGYGGSGHTAIYKDGEIWSTPIKRSSTFVKYSSIDALIEAYRKAGITLTYLGWSEDLGGTQLIKQEEVEMIGSGENWYNRLNQLHKQLLGRPMSRDVFKAFVGKDLLTFVETVSDHPETSARESLETKWETFYKTWADKGELTTKAEYVALNEELKKAQEKIVKAEQALEAEKAKPVEPPMTDEKGWQWLLSKIKGIFVK